MTLQDFELLHSIEDELTGGRSCCGRSLRLTTDNRLTSVVSHWSPVQAAPFGPFFRQPLRQVLRLRCRVRLGGLICSCWCSRFAPFCHSLRRVKFRNACRDFLKQSILTYEGRGAHALPLGLRAGVPSSAATVDLASILKDFDAGGPPIAGHEADCKTSEGKAGCGHPVSISIIGII